MRRCSEKHQAAPRRGEGGWDCPPPPTPAPCDTPRSPVAGRRTAMPPPPRIPPREKRRADRGALAGPSDLTYLSRSSCGPPQWNRGGGGGWSARGARALAHCRRARRAARSGKGDQDGDRQHARLPSTGKRPSPCRSVDRPNALPGTAASPVAVLVAPRAPSPRLVGLQPCSHRSRCRARLGGIQPVSLMGPPAAVLCARLRACCTRRHLVLRAHSHALRCRQSTCAPFAGHMPVALHLPARLGLK